MSKKKNNIIKFPSSISKIERKVEAILFAASEPLDIETIEKRLQNVKNVKKILDKIQLEYKSRGINLVCIRNKWSFRTASDLSNTMALQKSTQKNYLKLQLKRYLLLYIISLSLDLKLNKYVE